MRSRHKQLFIGVLFSALIIVLGSAVILLISGIFYKLVLSQGIADKAAELATLDQTTISNSEFLAIFLNVTSDVTVSLYNLTNHFDFLVGAALPSFDIIQYNFTKHRMVSNASTMQGRLIFNFVDVYTPVDAAEEARLLEDRIVQVDVSYVARVSGFEPQPVVSESALFGDVAYQAVRVVEANFANHSSPLLASLRLACLPRYLDMVLYFFSYSRDEVIEQWRDRESTASRMLFNGQTVADFSANPDFVGFEPQPSCISAPSARALWDPLSAFSLLTLDGLAVWQRERTDSDSANVSAVLSPLSLSERICIGTWLDQLVWAVSGPAADGYFSLITNNFSLSAATWADVGLLQFLNGAVSLPLAGLPSLRAMPAAASLSWRVLDPSNELSLDRPAWTLTGHRYP